MSKPQLELFWPTTGPRPHEDEEPFVDTFRKSINQTRGYAFKNYWDLHRWSCDKPDEFWSDVWDYCGIIGEKGRAVGFSIANSESPCYDRNIPINKPQQWFPGAKFNAAENMLLSHPNARSKTRYAVISTVEPDRTSANPREPVELGRLTWEELYQEVGRAAQAMRELGVKPNDSVVTFGASNCEMVIVYLATMTVGALFSSTPAEFGAYAVIDRYSLLQPKILFTIDTYRYGGKTHEVTERAKTVVKALTDAGKLDHVVVIGHLAKDREPAPSSLSGYAAGPTVRSWSSFMKLGDNRPATIPFFRTDFNHPIWIVFSSGTTGKPKSILGPGGGLILSRKMTTQFHFGLNHRDLMLQFSTMGWIVYNLSINFLATGGTVLCYDGSPFHPPEIMWRLVEKYKAVQLGVSPRYIQSLARSGFNPREQFDLSSLKQMSLTGSPVTNDVYDWVAKLGGVFVSNNSGGTEIGGALLHSTHTLPAYKGQLQVPALGIDLVAYNEQGKPVKDQEGTMVVRTAFPNMPLAFLDDPDGKRYQETYFADFDHPVFNMNDNIYQSSENGGIWLLGRSDGVLNPSGVRFGSAELYYILEKEFKHDVADSLAVGQKLKNGDERVILFLVTPDNKPLEADLVKKIQGAIAQRLSRRHVPAVMERCPGVPVTLSGKKLESSVKKLVNGMPLDRINNTGVQNPELFAFYAAWYKANVERQSKL